MYMIIDCNNFYASCERVFNPKLNHQPIVVLSNNDGCIIARSNEAKALGIKMGQPFFEVSDLCQKKQVYVFSSNYALYGDMSHRVMSIIESYWPEHEVYSIDEAFLMISGLDESKIKDFSYQLINAIEKSTGIPVSIGVGQTKTLAKCANGIAKKKLKIPYFNISKNLDWLRKIEISEVWGIGRRLEKKLNLDGKISAEDLRNTPYEIIKRKYNITLAKTVLELQGQACFFLEGPTARKTIMSSRSFANPQTDFNAISGALLAFCDLAATKLRDQKSVTQRISVFLSTSPFKTIERQYKTHYTINLMAATDDIRTINHLANQCLKKLYKKGYSYKKVGVCLENLKENNQVQLSFLNDGPCFNQANSKKLMHIYDKINQRYGRSTLKTAANQLSKYNGTRAFYRSPRYTTSWHELPNVW